MHARLARSSDGEAIRSIYNAEVVGSTATFDLVPRTPQEQVAWLEEHRGPYPAVVAGLQRLISGLTYRSGGRTRTDDNSIMSRVLCQLSYAALRSPASASPLSESNRRHQPYHGCALPTELRGRC